jgi:hypothetical protein
VSSFHSDEEGCIVRSGEDEVYYIVTFLPFHGSTQVITTVGDASTDLHDADAPPFRRQDVVTYIGCRAHSESYHPI